MNRVWVPRSLRHLYVAALQCPVFWALGVMYLCMSMRFEFLRARARLPPLPREGSMRRRRSIGRYIKGPRACA